MEIVVDMKIILTELAKELQLGSKHTFMPNRGTTESAGYDIRACIVRPLTIYAGECIRIPLGFYMHINDVELAGLILPRSGLGATHGIVLGNLVGLIDADYQEEWQCAIWNRNTEGSIVISPLDKIAQIMFVPVVHPKFEIASSFPKSTSRIGGFGSTDNVTNIKGVA